MWKRLGLAVASVLVALLAVELWFRAQAPRGPRTVITEEGEEIRSVYEPEEKLVQKWRARLARLKAGAISPHVFNRFSARYGWANVPGGEGDHGGYRVSFSSIGARGGREVGERPPEGALRLACYGESFTYGSEVDDDDTWPAQLEVQAGGALEVINLGVGGWGTDQALLRFRDTWEQLSSDVVLMGMLSENIARNVNRLRPVYARGSGEPLVKPRFILKEGRLELQPQPYATEVELYQAAVDGSLGIDMAPHEWWAPREESGEWLNVLAALNSRKDTQRRRRWHQEWRRPEGEPFQVSLALLEAFHREALEGGARFAGVILYPTKGDINDPERRLVLLVEALEQREIPYLDLFGLVRARLDRGEPAYRKTHFNPATNGEVAAAVWGWLREELAL